MSDLYIIVENNLNPVFVVEEITNVDVATTGAGTSTEETVWQTSVTTETWPVYANEVVYQLTPTETIATGGSGKDWIHVGPTPPDNPQVGDLWLDTN